MNILVTYGSRYGSTAEAAIIITDELRRLGDTVDVAEASPHLDLDNRDLIIVGSGIYIGRLRRCVTRLIKELRRRDDTPFAVFALGPLGADQFGDARRQLDKTLERLRVETTPRAVFGGAVVPERMPFVFTHMDSADLRSPQALREWAVEQRNRALAKTTSHHE